jgi:hypothetical protein
MSLPRFVVLPFRATSPEGFDGCGLSLHFLLGNVMVMNHHLKEFWFGWRVKRLFADAETLQTYCHGRMAELETTRLGAEQGIRYWLAGSVRSASPVPVLDAVLYDAETGKNHRCPGLAVAPSDHLIGLRRELLTWLADAGVAFPAAQLDKALWPEYTTLPALQALGGAMAHFYAHSAFGQGEPLEMAPYDKAVAGAEKSFLAHDMRGWALYRNQEIDAARDAFTTAIALNPDGAGVAAGLMWCAVADGDRDGALRWATAKAGSMGVDPEPTRRQALKALEKRNAGT